MAKRYYLLVLDSGGKPDLEIEFDNCEIHIQNQRQSSFGLDGVPARGLTGSKRMTLKLYDHGFDFESGGDWEITPDGSRMIPRETHE